MFVIISAKQIFKHFTTIIAFLLLLLSYKSIVFADVCDPGCWSTEGEVDCSEPSVPCTNGGNICDGTKDYYYKLQNCILGIYVGCGGCGGGCFTPDTPIDTPEGEKKIKDLKKGDEVESFDLESKEEKNSIVEKIYETTRSAYYKIKTKDGKEIKVTAEHPLYAIQKDNTSLNFLEYLKNESFTRKLIDRVLGE